MNTQGFIGANKHCYRFRLHFFVTAFAVDMLFQVTGYLLHGNCGKNQCICRAKNHNACHHLYDLMPYALLSVLLRILFRFFPKCFLHYRTSHLLKSAKLLQRPNSKYNSSHDLLFCHTANDGMSGVHRCGSMVTHDKNLAVGYLIRKFYVRITK